MEECTCGKEYRYLSSAAHVPEIHCVNFQSVTETFLCGKEYRYLSSAAHVPEIHCVNFQSVTETV